MAAKNAALEKTGSHWIEANNSGEIEREQVSFYFTAEWRSQPVRVEVEAERYRHSGGMSDWRAHACASRYIDGEARGGRGEDTTGTARSALSELCVPIAKAWLQSSEYWRSYRCALACMIMRRFNDNRVFVAERVLRLLDVHGDQPSPLGDKLAPPVVKAIRETVDALSEYGAAKSRAFKAIRGDATANLRAAGATDQ